MQLPLCLSWTSRVSVLTGSLLFLPFIVSAQQSDISFKAATGFYNSKDESSSVSESLSGNLLLGAQLPINDTWKVSLDSVLFENNMSNAYAGLTLDYITSMSDTYDLYARLGADFANGETIPKLGVGIERDLNNQFALTLETVARDTDRYADYQFFIGLKYDIASNSYAQEVQPDAIIDDYVVKDSSELSFKDLSHATEHKKLNATYIVEKGDTLWDISIREHVKLDSLIMKNKSIIKNPDLIYPDMVLEIPYLD